MARVETTVSEMSERECERVEDRCRGECKEDDEA